MTEQTSMSMTLAQGIVKRDTRILRESRYSFDEAIYKFNRFQKKKLSARTSHLEAILLESRCFTCEFITNSRYKKVWVVYALLDNGTFAYHRLKIDRSGFAVADIPVVITAHALARIVYRKNLKKMVAAFDEFYDSDDMLLFTHLQLTKIGQQTTMKTTSGMAIFVLSEDKTACLVTWVLESQEKGQQKEVNQDMLSVLTGVADSHGTDIRGYMKKQTETTVTMLAQRRSQGMIIKDADELVDIIATGIENNRPPEFTHRSSVCQE